VWDNRIARIKADRQAKEAELAKIDIDLSYMHGLLVNKPDETRVQELALQVQIASNDASEAFDVAESIKLRIRQASEDNTNISTRLSDIAKEMRSITSDINSIESQLASLHRAYLEQVAEVSIDKPTPEMVDHQNAIQFINGQIASKRYDLEQMLPGAGKCNRCGSNVSFEHLERQKSLIKVSISELEEKLAYHTEEYNKAATAHQVATLEKLNNLESELEKNKAPLEDQLSALKTKYSKAEIQFNLLKIEQSNLSTKLDKLHKEYNEALRIHNDKVKKHYELELLYKNELSNLDAWHQNKSKLDTLMAMRSTVAEEIDILDTLERLFGDRGLKAMRLDNIISTLNSFIDSGLKLLTDGQVKVKISSTRKKSDGDTTIDINIMVQEGPKEDIPFQLYSGGERQQITLAIVNALSEYASLNGVGYNILCLDEIFGPLDDTNSQLVYRYLEYKKSRGSSTIFIITHNPEVKNQLKFDKILTVVKKDGLSTIEGI
jgi:DNA repair exonuclease SbcCD ATPase subunit